MISPWSLEENRSLRDINFLGQKEDNFSELDWDLSDLLNPHLPFLGPRCGVAGT